MIQTVYQGQRTIPFQCKDKCTRIATDLLTNLLLKKEKDDKVIEEPSPVL